MLLLKNTGKKKCKEGRSGLDDTKGADPGFLKEGVGLAFIKFILYYSITNQQQFLHLSSVLI